MVEILAKGTAVRIVRKILSQAWQIYIYGHDPKGNYLLAKLRAVFRKRYA